MEIQIKELSYTIANSEQFWKIQENKCNLGNQKKD